MHDLHYQLQHKQTRICGTDSKLCTSVRPNSETLDYLWYQRGRSPKEGLEYVKVLTRLQIPLETVLTLFLL